MRKIETALIGKSHHQSSIPCLTSRVTLKVLLTCSKNGDRVSPSASLQSCFTGFIKTGERLSVPTVSIQKDHYWFDLSCQLASFFLCWWKSWAFPKCSVLRSPRTLGQPGCHINCAHFTQQQDSLARSILRKEVRANKWKTTLWEMVITPRRADLQGHDQGQKLCFP